jgi:hypothetical protein
MGEQGGAVDLEDVEEQRLGVAVGMLAEMRGCRQCGRRFGDRLAEGHGCS